MHWISLLNYIWRNCWRISLKNLLRSSEARQIGQKYYLKLKNVISSIIASAAKRIWVKECTQNLKWPKWLCERSWFASIFKLNLPYKGLIIKFKKKSKKNILKNSKKMDQSLLNLPLYKNELKCYLAVIYGTNFKPIKWFDFSHVIKLNQWESQTYLIEPTYSWQA